MKRKGQIWIYSVLILLILSAFAFFKIFFAAKSHTEVILFVATTISVLVALMAYQISIMTYVSIDSVNAISRMDGNVMENSGYRASIFARLRTFEDTNRKDACEQLLKVMEKLFDRKNIKTLSGAKLADNIQEIIDMIVLVPFIINPCKDEEEDEALYEKNIKRFEELVRKMEKSVSDLEQLSEGSIILLKESVMLVKAVFSFQKIGFGNEASPVSLLVDVRGTMFKNQISRTVYHNYYGLFYLRKGLDCAMKICGTKGNAYDLVNIKRYNETPESEETSHAVTYLMEAIRYFDKATEFIEDEIMWNAFIKYNKARAQYFLSILVKDDESYKTVWADTMNEAIRYRAKLNMLLSDILPSKDPTYFQRAFIDEEKFACLIKLKFEIASGLDITNRLGNVILTKEEYSKIRNLPIINPTEQDEFLNLNMHRDDIINYCK